MYFSQPFLIPASIAKSGFLPKILFWYILVCFENNSQDGKEITLTFIFSLDKSIELLTAISTSDPEASIVALYFLCSIIG